MEVPIKVMITLFVTLVVGFAIISFSRQIIEKSRSDLENTNPGSDLDDDEEQKIIELSVLDNQQTIDLVSECYDRNHGRVLERTLCFVVIAKSADTGLNFGQIETEGETATGADVVIDGLSATDYAIRMVYDPLGSQDRIILSK
jgi:hypothetical protein